MKLENYFVSLVKLIRCNKTKRLCTEYMQVAKKINEIKILIFKKDI